MNQPITAKHPWPRNLWRLANHILLGLGILVVVVLLAAIVDGARRDAAQEESTNAAWRAWRTEHCSLIGQGVAAGHGMTRYSLTTFPIHTIEWTCDDGQHYAMPWNTNDAHGPLPQEVPDLWVRLHIKTKPGA